MSKAEELAERISAKTDWYEFDYQSWCAEAAGLLRQQDEAIRVALEALEEIVGVKMTYKQAEAIKLLREVQG